MNPSTVNGVMAAEIRRYSNGTIVAHINSVIRRIGAPSERGSYHYGRNMNLEHLTKPPLPYRERVGVRVDPPINFKSCFDRQLHVITVLNPVP